MKKEGLNWIKIQKTELNARVYIKSIIVKRLLRLNKETVNWIEQIKLKQKLQLLNFATNGQPYAMLLSKDSD